MQIIGDAFAGHYTAKRRDGEFGMEIETETKSIANYPSDFFQGENNEKGKPGIAHYKVPIPKWKAVSDNSLRNFGIEFIFKEPYEFKEALKAIELFGEATKKVKFIENAPATSVHVHINMFNETFLTLGNFCTLYILFENILQEFAGEFRRSNLFSMPSRCSEPVVWNIVSMFEQMERGEASCISWSEENVKYAALNIAPLSYLGSIEIRSMRGVTDPEMLSNWLRIINSLLTFSRLAGVTPREIIHEYRSRNFDFFFEVFGEMSYHLEKACKGRIIPLIDRNIYYASSISSCVRDWNTLGDLIKPRVAGEKKVQKKKWNDIVMDHAIVEQEFADVAVGNLINAQQALMNIGWNPPQPIPVEPQQGNIPVPGVGQEWWVEPAEPEQDEGDF